MYPLSLTASRVTELGIRYIQAEGVEKQQLALELLECFHSYLAKYVDMILRGHLPRYLGKVNEDAEKLLTYLLPKGSKKRLIRGL